MALAKKIVWISDDGQEFTDRKAANAHGRVAELVNIVKTASSPEAAVQAILSGYRVMKNTGQKRPRKPKVEAAKAPAAANGKHKEHATA